MRPTRLRVTFGLCVISMAVACGWGSGRNHPNSGNPAKETLVEQCSIEGWTIRLYEGNGGATSAFWTSLTAQAEGVAERQVLYAYADPSFDHLACSEAVVLTGSRRAEIAVARLAGLQEQPLRWYRGEALQP